MSTSKLSIDESSSSSSELAVVDVSVNVADTEAAKKPVGAAAKMAAEVKAAKGAARPASAGAKAVGDKAKGRGLVTPKK